jgi:hypothetical protein
MFDVYKRKFPEQPFPRRHVGQFESVDAIMATFDLNPEEIIEGLTAVTEHGYQIEKAYNFLGEGRTQVEIAEILGIRQQVVQRRLKKAVIKMKKNKCLAQLLSEKAQHMDKPYEIEVSERISVTI